MSRLRIRRRNRSLICAVALSHTPSAGLRFLALFEQFRAAGAVRS